jgi:phthalate 4,5-cis-dihydrodiol dehydrogenase
MGEPEQLPLRLGLVGLGMAGGIMASAASLYPGVRIAGAADRNEELRSRFAKDHSVPVHSDIAGLITDPEIDAVYIATPHQFHCEHTIRALESGKHVVVEKPMALSLTDCDEMIRAADASGRVLIVGHTHSFDPAIRKIRELVKTGTVGEIAMLAMWNYTNFLYRPRRPEELDTTKGGGIIFNQLPHQIDVARYLIEAPVRTVRAMTAVLDSTRPTEGACTALIGFQNDVAATLTYSGYDRFDSDELHGWINEVGFPVKSSYGAARRAIDVMGGPAAEIAARTKRYGYGSAMLPGKAPHQPHFGTMVVTCRDADMRQSADGVLMYNKEGMHEVTIEPTPWHAGFGDVIHELYCAVRWGKPPVHSGRFARGTVEIIMAILASSRERREITLE